MGLYPAGGRRPLADAKGQYREQGGEHEQHPRERDRDVHTHPADAGNLHLARDMGQYRGRDRRTDERPAGASKERCWVRELDEDEDAEEREDRDGCGDAAMRSARAGDEQ